MEVGDDGVCCDLCGKWHHWDKHCSNIDEKYKSLLDSENIWYICKKCKQSNSRERGQLTTTDVENKLEDLKTNQEILKVMSNDVIVNTNAIHNKIENVDRDMKTVTNKTKTYA